MKLDTGTYRLSVNLVDYEGPDVIHHGLDDVLDLVELVVKHARQHGSSDLVWDALFGEVDVTVAGGGHE